MKWFGDDDEDDQDDDDFFVCMNDDEVLINEFNSDNPATIFECVNCWKNFYQNDDWL